MLQKNQVSIFLSFFLSSQADRWMEMSEEDGGGGKVTGVRFWGWGVLFVFQLFLLSTHMKNSGEDGLSLVEPASLKPLLASFSHLSL